MKEIKCKNGGGIFVDEMKRMVSALSRYVDEEEQSMSRLK